MSSDSSADLAAQNDTLEPITPVARRRLQACYEHATKLIEKDDYDFDYVHTILSPCVSQDPSNLVYVEEMLTNLRRKYKNNKKGGRVKGHKGKGTWKKVVLKEDWREVLNLTPEVLHPNPWDVAALREIAKACEFFHLNEVELRYLKAALDGKPKDAEVNRHCAKSLARMGLFDMAIACWHRVEEASRGDSEAPQAISELTLLKNRQHAGFDDELESSDQIDAGEEPSKRDRPSPQKAPSAAAEPEEATEEIHANEATDKTAPASSGIQLTPRQQLEQAIAKDPTDLPSYVKLASLLKKKGHYPEAEQVLTKALEASGGGELTIREKLEDAQMLRAKATLAIAERKAKNDQTGQDQELAKNLRNELLRMEIEIFAARCQRHPEEVRYHMELGIRLKRVGQYSEAIAALQQGAKTKTWKCRANLEIGECFHRAHKYDKALVCYERAIKSAGDNEQETLKKSLYRAGTLAIGLKKVDFAKKWLTDLSLLDPGYRDIVSRLDSLREISDN